MESMHAKLRVKELYEAQQQVATFAVEQAKSLLLSLKLDGRSAEYALPESELVEALGRVLPDEETAIVLAFLQSTASAKKLPPDYVPTSPDRTATPPPSLNDYLQTMSKMDAITRLKYVFVAVGLAITDKDKHELTKRTPWGAQLVQTTTGKSWHRNIHHEKHNTTQPSYIEASIVDFYTCREASWLVGWPGTTFGRTLAGLQIFDHQDGGWYRVCPPGGATPKELGPTIKWVSWYNNHQACMNKSTTYKKLGG